MTVGMAIEKDLLCLVLAPQRMDLPYLLEGAKDSKAAKLSVALYTDIASVKHLFDNNGLTLFGGDDALIVTSPSAACGSPVCPRRVCP